MTEARFLHTFSLDAKTERELVELTDKGNKIIDIVKKGMEVTKENLKKRR